MIGTKESIRELIGAQSHTYISQGLAPALHLESCLRCRMESALTAAEQELRERDGAIAAECYSKGHDAAYKEMGAKADARVAAALEMAAQKMDAKAEEHEAAHLVHYATVYDTWLFAAKIIRALITPAQTSALEKLLAQARIEEAKWWHANCPNCIQGVFCNGANRLAALTEKQPEVKP